MSSTIRMFSMLALGLTTCSVSERSPARATDLPVAFHAKVISQRSCEYRENRYVESFEIATSYENVGTTPLAVFMGLHGLAGWLVARTPEDLTNGVIEAQHGVDSGFLQEEVNSREEKRIRLKPGEEVKGTGRFNLFVSKAASTTGLPRVIPMLLLETGGESTRRPVLIEAQDIPATPVRDPGMVLGKTGKHVVKLAHFIRVLRSSAKKTEWLTVFTVLEVILPDRPVLSRCD